MRKGRKEFPGGEAEGGGHFKGGRVATPFPLLKCLRTLYGKHCKPFSGQNALDCRILHIQSQIFSRSNTPPGPPQWERVTLSATIHSTAVRGGHKRPGAWTQTPISARLASVPIVPVLRNDYWRGYMLALATNPIRQTRPRQLSVTFQAWISMLKAAPLLGDKRNITLTKMLTHAAKFWGFKNLSNPISATHPLTPILLGTVTRGYHTSPSAFCVAVAKTWNSLPSEVTSSATLSKLKLKLKTYLFHFHFPARNISAFLPILLYSDCNAFAFVHFEFLLLLITALNA